MKNILDGPIPGENYTSDTRNYPWHRPPDITSIDKGIEYSMQKITGRKEVGDLLTLVQAGVPLAMLADMFVTANIGKGKWTPDFAILLAGPVTRIMEMICKGYEVEYDLGLDEPPVMTFEALAGFMSDKSEESDENMSTEDPLEEANEPTTVETPPALKGFAGMKSKTKASSEVQNEMLGRNN